MLSILPREKDRAKLIYEERLTFFILLLCIKLTPLTIKIRRRGYVSICETRDFCMWITQEADISRNRSLVKVSCREPLSGIRSRPSRWKKNVSRPTCIRFRRQGMNNHARCTKLCMPCPKKDRNNLQRIRNGFKVVSRYSTYDVIRRDTILIPLSLIASKI